MGASDIPPLQYTPTDDVQARVAALRQSFNEHKTRDVEFRLVQLRRLYWAYVLSPPPSPLPPGKDKEKKN